MTALPPQPLRTPRRAVVLEKGPGYCDTLEITRAFGSVVFQFIRDQDGMPTEITTMTWPAELHRAVVAMMGEVGCG